MEMVQDFVDKKEKLADLLEEYMANPDIEKELVDLVIVFAEDEDFKDKALFKSIFSDVMEYLHDLSRKEIKQRVLMIRSYLD